MKINDIKKRKIAIIISDIIILICTFFLYRKYEQSMFILTSGFILFTINSLRLKYDEKMKCIVDFIIKYRFVLALIIFIICVGFKVHGSSISYYDEIITNKIDDGKTGVLVGHGRGLRGDEFNVQTPYYFSQSYNNFNKTSYQMSLSGQDMIIGYNAPVKDLTLVGKPFTWGYFLLGNEYGLSWYWCMKTILFILVSFELCKLLTNNKKRISLLGSVLIVFSPVAQWWFSPHIYDVFFWSSALLVLSYYFFTVTNKYLKWIMTFLVSCSGIGFILGLFPSCQIPLGLIAIVLLVMLLYRDREKIDFGKKDRIRLIVAVMFVGVVLGQFLISSKENIVLLSETVYPGQRVSLGGENTLSDLFTDVTNIYLPYKDSNVLNNCEVSTFNHLGILFLLYFPCLYFKMKKDKNNNRFIGLTLTLILLIEIYFMIFGFPEWLAKITLFSYINRMKLIYGFTATLFTIWSMSTIIGSKRYINMNYAVFSIFMFMGLYIYSIPQANLDYFNSIATDHPDFYRNFPYLEILGFAAIGLFTFYRKRERLTSSLLVVIVLSSFTINPIAIGTPAIYNHPISEKISKLSQIEDGYWLATNSMVEQNFLLANGAKVINAVNFYPDYEKWNKIDPRKLNESAYNRYAHIVISLVDKQEATYKNEFSPDRLDVELPVTDLEKWKIKYVLTRENYDELFEKNGMKSTIEYHDTIDNIYIYSLVYE